MAGGSPICRLGDMESGHQCYYPVVTVTCSPSVYVNKIGACHVGNITKTHKCPKKPSHPDKIVKGSKTVRIHKKSAAQIGSLLAPGGAVMCEGSHSVYTGL